MAHKISWDRFMEKQRNMLAFFRDQDQEIRKIDPQAAADHMKLWASSPVWGRGKEEIELCNKMLDRIGRQMAYKMALVVRTDLGMGKGKIAAQCGHAASRLTHQCLLVHDYTHLLADWCKDDPPERKVVLRVDSEKALLDIAEACLKLGILHTVIADSGKTQIEPGSITVLGIGPDTSERIDAVVGDLKLL